MYGRFQKQLLIPENFTFELKISSFKLEIANSIKQKVFIPAVSRSLKKKKIFVSEGQFFCHSLL